MTISGIEKIEYSPATKDVVIKHKGKQYARPFAKTVRFNINPEDQVWKEIKQVEHKSHYGFDWSVFDYSGYDEDDY